MNPKGHDQNVISSNDDLKPDTLRLYQKKYNKNSNFNNLTDNKSEIIKDNHPESVKHNSSLSILKDN